MVQQKESAIAKMNRRSIAQLIEQGKAESAKIRVENIIREDINVELLEILELYCELLLARIGLMDAKECDPGLEEAVKSLIYAAPRTDVKELQQVRLLLVEKYGKEFALAAMDNSDQKVADRVLKRLKVEPPAQDLIELYLQEIARTYNVSYGLPSASEVDATEDNINDDDQPSSGALLEEPIGNAEKLMHATPPRNISSGPRSPIAVVPPNPTTDNLKPTVKIPQPPAMKPLIPKKEVPVSKASESSSPDFDELSRRFAALKKLP